MYSVILWSSTYGAEPTLNPAICLRKYRLGPSLQSTQQSVYATTVWSRAYTQPRNVVTQVPTRAEPTLNPARLLTFVPLALLSSSVFLLVLRGAPGSFVPLVLVLCSVEASLAAAKGRH